MRRLVGTLRPESPCLLVALMLSACLAPGTTQCEDRLCPATTVCAPALDRCVLPEQIDACGGQADEAPCSFGGTNGACLDGVCLAVGCGNGVIEPGEVCDDQNIAGGDGCSADCRSTEVCGNNIVDPAVGEQCDDGNNEDGDGCQADCRLPFCGDGVVDTGEVCDDGNNEDDDGCNAQCSSDESCGNGVIDVVNDEQCDDGNTDEGDGCGPSCKIEICGNEIQDPGEVCDDGNTAPGDGCGPNCLSLEVCGNGIRDLGEGCDCGDGSGALPSGCDGPNSSDVGAQCRTDCTIPGCGDGVIEGLEQCEGADLDGKDCTDLGFYNAAGLACTAQCTFDTSGCSERCGDGTIDASGDEDCDGANLGGVTCQDLGYYDQPGLACDGLCRFDDDACTGYCGDATVNGGEYCDGTAPSADTCLDFGFDIGLLECSGLCSPGFEKCSSMGWEETTIETPVTKPISLLSIWGVSGSDVFAAGYWGRVVHFDGSGWILSETGGSYINAVGGTAADDVFSVGYSGQIHHFDGTSWTPMVSNTSTRLNGVWAADSGEAFAVGDSGTIVQYDGAAWTVVTPAPTGEHLEAVWGAGAGDVFAVGTGGVVFHYDGSNWTPMTSNTGVDLYGVWGAAGDDVYAVGASGTILHYDGVSWSSTTTGGGEALRSVSGTDGANVFVGGGGAVYRYDGYGWHRQDAGVVSGFSSLWVAPDGEAFAIGSENDRVLHYEGTYREPMASPTSNHLLGAWGVDGGDLFVVGTPSSDTSVVLRYQGESFAATTFPAPAPGLKDVWSAASDDVFAVGPLGEILHFDGSTWSEMTSNTASWLNGVWGAGSSDVFAVGQSGTIMHYDGSNWAPMTSNTGKDLNAVWGSSGSDVYAAGVNTAMHYDGSSWSQLFAYSNVLLSVWGTGPDDVFFAGSYNGEGSLLHYDGAGTTTILSGGQRPADFLYDVWGTRGDDVFVAGDGGSLYHYDGHTLSPIDSGTAEDLRWVWGDGEQLFAGGRNGTILHILHDRPCKEAVAIGCGDTISSTTVGGPSELDTASCRARPTTGTEAAFYFDYDPPPYVSSNVTVTVSGMSADLDLSLVAGDGWGACDASRRCLDASATSGDEQLTFNVKRDRRYYFLVDGYDGAQGSFDINVTCN